MSMQQTSALNVALGAMNFGSAAYKARVSDVKEVVAMVDVFQKHGHTEVDTARLYSLGTSEEVLAEIGWQDRGLVMQTKLWPTGYTTKAHPVPSAMEPIHHTPELLRKYLKLSLDALKTEKIDIFYLHAPDRSVPFESTLKAIDELHKEGHFQRFGISNFASWEVAEVVTICRANGWIQPTVYQGVYSALQRRVEPELFPCLRKFGISFYAFSVLGGGFFAGKFDSKDAEVEKGTRYSSETLTGKYFRSRYWNDPHFHAIEIVKPVAEKHGLTLAEVALRWISHHSEMKRELGDTIIVGGSSAEQLEKNLVDLDKGPLPEDVVDALKRAWMVVQPHAADYWFMF